MTALSSLHIIGSRNSGGAERFYMRLVLSLKEQGLQIVAVNRPRSAVSKELSGRVDQIQIPMYNVRDPVSRYRISKTISRLAPHIVQTYMGRATRLTRVPADCRTIHLSRLGGFYKLAGYRHADAWIGNTSSICDYLKENGFPADRIFLLPNFVEIPAPIDDGTIRTLKTGLGIPEDAVLIAGIGRLVEKKGFIHLIDSFSSLPEEMDGRPLHLVIVGSGPYESRLKDFAASTEASRRIHWAGWQPEPDPFYAMADLFVCPSLHEPLGNVIMEAWSNGTPVISTGTHGARELIQEGVNGLLVPCGDTDVLTEKIKMFLGDRVSITRDLVSGGFSTLAARFGKDAVVKSYITLYEKLVLMGPRVLKG